MQYICIYGIINTTRTGNIQSIYFIIYARGETSMTEAAKEARRAYKRSWNRANKDRIKEYQERHWEKVAARTAAAEAVPEPAAE